MVMEVSVEYLIDKLGHDGSEIIFPTLPEPECRKSFNIQELIILALDFGYSFTPIVKQYTVFPRGEEAPYRNDLSLSDEHLFELMSRFSGVLTGTTYSGLRHAVAWDRHMILDPNGWKYDRTRFIMEVFWAVGRLS
jgi:hypothetical protein